MFSQPNRWRTWWSSYFRIWKLKIFRWKLIQKVWESRARETFRSTHPFRVCRESALRENEVMSVRERIETKRKFLVSNLNDEAKKIKLITARTFQASSVQIIDVDRACGDPRNLSVFKEEICDISELPLVSWINYAWEIGVCLTNEDVILVFYYLGSVQPNPKNRNLYRACDLTRTCDCHSNIMSQ